MYTIEFEAGHPARVRCETADELRAVMVNGSSVHSTRGQVADFLASHPLRGQQPRKRSDSNAAKIRGYLKKHPKATPTEVVAGLLRQGVVVTNAQVSNALR